MSGCEMRVIAGQFRGARLFAPKDSLIRPTTDRVREYVFSCIHHEVVDKKFADLFCGTGAVGIEAKSRGAATVSFVDSSRSAIGLLEKNLEKVGVDADIYKRPVESFLKFFNDPQPFDFIFCDPPYKYNQFDKVLNLLVNQHLLCKDGLLIYESDSRHDAPIHEDFTIIRQKKMGETLITFYRYEHGQDSNLSRDI